MYMKGLIRKLLREVMMSELDKWRENMNPLKDNNSIAYSTLISKDNETGEKLWLFVGFQIREKYDEYSYSFLLTDKDNNTKDNDGFIVNRKTASKYIPNEIKNKRLITPIIEYMTRQLLDAHLPQNLYMQTAEPLDGDSLKRYNELINIMTNEYGYKLIENKKDEFGCTFWKLTKNEITDKNKDMNEEYSIKHEYLLQERVTRAFTPLISQLPKI